MWFFEYVSMCRLSSGAHALRISLIPIATSFSSFHGRFGYVSKCAVSPFRCCVDACPLLGCSLCKALPSFSFVAPAPLRVPFGRQLCSVACVELVSEIGIDVGAPWTPPELRMQV